MLGVESSKSHFSLALRFQISFCFLIFGWEFLSLVLGDHASFPVLNAAFAGVSWILAFWRPAIALGILVFVLPFTGGIIDQINALFSVEIEALRSLSFDLVAGFLGGVGCRMLLRLEQKTANNPEGVYSPAQRILTGGLLVFYGLVILTGAIALSRNLAQAASPFFLDGFIYNFINFRYLNPFSDYFPLQDIALFGGAIALATYLIPRFHSHQHIYSSITLPLIASQGLLVLYALAQKVLGIGFLRSGAERGVNSFLPDIHAYGGYMLIGCFLGLYYLEKREGKWSDRRFAFSLLGLSSLGVLLSGSRFSIGLLFLVLLVRLLWNESFSLRQRLIYSAAGLLGAWAIAGLLSVALPNLKLLSPGKIFQAQSFQDVNIALSYRPEIFQSSLKMFSSYPWLGIGKGEFYRQSSIGDFSESFFFSRQHRGENAHNYFLQILTEMGIIGFASFAFIFIYKYWVYQSTSEAIWVMLLGIAAGNLYGHSLLLPNILFLAFILIGAGNGPDVPVPPVFQRLRLPRAPKTWILSVGGLAALLGVAGVEVAGAYERVPFRSEYACHRFAFYPDGQTGGIFEQEFRAGSRFLVAEYRVHHSHVRQHPLELSWAIAQKGRTVQQVTQTLYRRGHYQQILDLSALRPRSKFTLTLKATPCFTPLNAGDSLDMRRLGVQLLEIRQQPTPLVKQESGSA